LCFVLLIFFFVFLKFVFDFVMFGCRVV